MNRVLAMWLPNWPIQRLVSKQPQFATGPLVLHRSTRAGQLVSACCSAAAELGVRVDMPLAEAKVLTNRASAKLQEHDQAADRTSLIKLAQWLHRYSPHVGVEDNNTLLLDATNLAPLYGGEDALVQQVARGLAKLKLTARLALADTIAVSWAVAHFGEGQTAIETEHATLTSCRIAAGESMAALAPLPVAALRLPAAALSLLPELGIEQVEALLALPRAELHARFGDDLIKRLHQAQGTAREIIRVVPPPQQLQAQWLLESTVTNRDALRGIVRQLLEQLLARLVARGEGITRATLKFYCEGQQSADCEARLFRPSCNADHVLEILDLQFEQLLLPAGVLGIQVSIADHQPRGLFQQRLFEERTLGDSAQLGVLIDQLGARLGTQAVLQAELRHDAQPEYSYRLRPLVEQQGTRPSIKGSATKGPVHGTLARPVRLLPRPLAIDVLATIPDGPPRRFQSTHQQHDIARFWGPERIESGWWRRRMIERDYYRVETTTGQRMWLFRRRDDGQWFLHAYFD